MLRDDAESRASVEQSVHATMTDDRQAELGEFAGEESTTDDTDVDLARRVEKNAESIAQLSDLLDKTIDNIDTLAGGGAFAGGDEGPRPDAGDDLRMYQ